MNRQQASDFKQELLNLFDDYVHGRVARRDFLQRASKFAVGGVTAEALLASLSPNYSWAQQVAKDDPRLRTEYIEYSPPQGAGTMRGLLARPAAQEKSPAVVVVHENRGLNPYIEDVARRLAVAGFLALAPDALTPLGGYPGNDDEGRALQQRRNGEEMIQDFMAAARLLKTHALSTGKVGVVGFCYGGGVANQLAVRLPDVIVAAVPYYGSQPTAADVPKIKAAVCLHYAEMDTRINAGWPAYEQALKAAGATYEAHMYPATNHGFHNDTTPRYDEAAAKLSWERTLAFFRKHLA
jgi:carboxymethylenebutenolidase